MRCDEIAQLLPSYVLGDATDAEIDHVERHVEGCEACDRELESVRALGALLDDALLGARPPASLKDAAFARVQAEDLGVLLGGTSVAAPPADLKERALSRALTDPGTAGATKRRRAGLLAVAAAVTGIGIAAGSQMQVQDLDRRLATMQASVRQAEDSFGPMGHPMQEVRLAGNDATGEAELLHFKHDNYRMTVKLDDIEVTPPGHHYEMWVAGEEGEVSVGSFRLKRPDDLTLSFTMGVDPADFPEVLITLEPTDGDPRMSSDLVATAWLDRDAIHHGTNEE